jgi:hypothetical protein
LIRRGVAFILHCIYVRLLLKIQAKIRLNQHCLSTIADEVTRFTQTLHVFIFPATMTNVFRTLKITILLRAKTACFLLGSSLSSLRTARTGWPSRRDMFGLRRMDKDSVISAMAGIALCAMTTVSQAGVINGGSLLDAQGADQLETWLGSGDLDFTNIFTGVATGSQFHSAADNAGPTFSIYGITKEPGQQMRVGGYTQISWNTANAPADVTAFLFNLDTLEAQFSQRLPQNAINMPAPNYFPAFGGGHDLFGGFGTLGTCNGVGLGDFASTCSGYSRNHSYDINQGQITVTGAAAYTMATVGPTTMPGLLTPLRSTRSRTLSLQQSRPPSALPAASSRPFRLGQ